MPRIQQSEMAVGQRFIFLSLTRNLSRNFLERLSMRLFLVTLIWCVQGAWAAYRESLAVLPLPSSGVPLHRLRWHFNQTQELPRDLQELVQEFPDMESLQWSMTQGRWNWKWSVAEDWAPSGLQVRVQWQQPSSSSTSNHEMYFEYYFC